METTHTMIGIYNVVFIVALLVIMLKKEKLSSYNGVSSKSHIYNSSKFYLIYVVLGLQN